ncbi:hypothetical protein EGW08_023473 [Elysia chlorotica]|uniref:Uncharacterized protein n=1 Tax=Elysia chlorotica TaxID=188477 RepID=A0A433SIX6_ELYCH|nr:hypothetical protein EGW08_023473 [Elysia chlorotica]
MDQTNISSSMLSSLLHYNFSFISYISPERFCSSLIKQLQNNLDCHSVPTKKDDLNLIAFSALIELLELSKREFSSHFAGPEDNYNFCSSDIKSDRNIDTVKKVPEKEREIVHKWFSETLKIMQASKKCIAYIMVKTSQEKKCKFAKFLSRQFFLIGLKTGFFEVSGFMS